LSTRRARRPRRCSGRSTRVLGLSAGADRRHPRRADLLVRRHLGERSDRRGRARGLLWAVAGSRDSERRHLDLVGTALTTVALLRAYRRRDRHQLHAWSSARTIGQLVADAVLLAFFLAWEHRRADPTIALRLACRIVPLSVVQALTAAKARRLDRSLGARTKMSAGMLLLSAGPSDSRRIHVGSSSSRAAAQANANELSTLVLAVRAARSPRSPAGRQRRERFGWWLAFPIGAARSRRRRCLLAGVLVVLALQPAGTRRLMWA
jgi:hypothetical protein